MGTSHIKMFILEFPRENDSDFPVNHTDMSEFLMQPEFLINSLRSTLRCKSFTYSLHLLTSI